MDTRNETEPKPTLPTVNVTIGFTPESAVERAHQQGQVRLIRSVFSLFKERTHMGDVLAYAEHLQSRMQLSEQDLDRILMQRKPQTIDEQEYLLVSDLRKIYQRYQDLAYLLCCQKTVA
ncbi:hypothetical protein HYW41_00875 [Candidatus Daviesbacteria bacterium]|nr:hypothetical protein [Candidatus Daviesbacteria bacterium]